MSGTDSAAAAGEVSASRGRKRSSYFSFPARSVPKASQRWSWLTAALPTAK